MAPCALLVEDEPLIRMIAREFLEEAGFTLVEASNSDEARAILEHHGSSIALLFTDVEMPGSRDGFALARYAAERWPDMDIVIASGRMVPQLGDMPSGATYLAKPFTATAIHNHLRKSLPEDRLPGQLRAAA